MFKIILIVALIAAVYSLPAPPSDSTLQTAEAVQSQVNPAVEASVKEVNGEVDPKNEKEELEGAEFGWGWKNWGWGYPVYRSYYYPSYYYPTYWW